MGEPIPQQIQSAGGLKIKTVFLFILVVLITAAISSGLTYFLISNSSGRRASELPAAPIVTPTTALPTPSEAKAEVKWATADMGVYTFNYPFGWHVASLWPNTMVEGINIVIDPKPISNAPRGGPLGEIVISDKNGLPNPDEVYQKDLESFRNLLTDLKEEVIQANIGEIRHLSGKANIYMEMKPVEGYYFMIQPSNLSDNANKHIMAAEIVDNPSGSEILKKIVMSFKKK